MPEIIIEARNVTKTFEKGGLFKGLKKRPTIRAVDNLSFSIKESQVFGLIGESGCGKTTTARLLLGLEKPTSGELLYRDQDLAKVDAKTRKSIRRRAQFIFQDPYESINPGMTIKQVLFEPMVIHGIGTNAEKLEKASLWLEKVGLSPPQNYLERFPHELSGGQRQRVAVARALILDPDFVAADEPTSMLDVSVRAGILNLLLSIKEELKLSYLLITHDLGVARYTCDYIGVMYNGNMVEKGPVEEIIRHGQHPYTRALLAVVSDFNRFWDNREEIIGNLERSHDFQGGCLFAPRCPRQRPGCFESKPELRDIASQHLIACNFPEDC